MNQFKTYFQQELQKQNSELFVVYPTAGGEVALAKDGLTAFVWTDGRYPEAKNGFSINQICTETITVLFGGIVLEIDEKVFVLNAGDQFSIKPNQKYSIAGKAVCKVDISPKWDSSQNSFTF
jgi:hypothetical protein